MKKSVIIAAILLLITPGFVFAQSEDEIRKAAAQAAQALNAAPAVQKEEEKPDYWDESAKIDIGFNNTQLNDWAAGGYNTITLKTSIDARANYKKDLGSWNNRLQLEYGFIYSDDKPFVQKNNDLIYLESKWGYSSSKQSKWKYTASFDFRSQFSNSYNYSNPGVEDPSKDDWIKSRKLKSGFLAPAYTNIALGMSCVPNDWLSVNIAPLTGGFTIVRDELLRGQYSMQAREDGTLRSGRFEFGAQIKTDVKFIINEVLRFESQMVLFSDYLDKPANLRVNWDNQISWQIARYFNISFKTWMIYDPKVLITSNKDIDKYPNGTQRIQFKEFLSFNFTYTFAKGK